MNARTVDIILSEGFVSTEFAAVVDVLRLANRVLGAETFKFQYLSTQSGEIRSSADTWLSASKIPNFPNADYAVFLGNSDLNFTSRSIEKAVNQYRHSGATVVLLAEAAAMFIASDKDSRSGHTTHWENRTLLEERKGIFDIESRIAVSNEDVITCAGLVATYDVMISLVGEHMSKAKLLTISSILLLDKVRSFETNQPGAMDALSAQTNSSIDSAIRLMQGNLEEPLSTQEISTSLGLTTRSLERQFRKHLGRSPARFYRELRLIRAQNLLMNTNMSISEVAAACGFDSNFGRAYKRYYDKTPYAARKGRMV